MKLQPFAAEQREFLAMTGLGVAEARSYAAVGSDLPVRVPRPFSVAFDDADGSFIMVLEDLHPPAAGSPSRATPTWWTSPSPWSTSSARSTPPSGAATSPGSAGTA